MPIGDKTDYTATTEGTYPWNHANGRALIVEIVNIAFRQWGKKKRYRPKLYWGDRLCMTCGRTNKQYALRQHPGLLLRVRCKPRGITVAVNQKSMTDFEQLPDRACLTATVLPPTDV